MDAQRQIPYPIEFERICALYPHFRDVDAAWDVYSALKKKLSARILRANLGFGELHSQIVGMSFDNIITTNYDQVVEKAYGIDVKRTNAANSAKYIMYSTSNARGTPRIYHAHGIATRALSICIGYEHYMGYVEKIRHSFFAGEKVNGYPPIVAKLINEHYQASTWPELLLMSNVFILGLELDFSEVDLWWLLIVRTSLGNVYSNYITQNKIVYYYIEPDGEKNQEVKHIDESKRARYELMRELDIEVMAIKANSYCDGYKLALADIKKRVKNSR